MRLQKKFPSRDIVIIMVKINLACRGLAGRPEVCNLVDVYCPASNKFVPFLSFGQDVKMTRSKADFESRWSRGPGLVTARSDLACLTVPRGDIF